jgi:hypothetical protein
MAPKKKEKAAVEAPKMEIPAEYQELSLSQLRQVQENLLHRLAKTQRDRSYLQLERDQLFRNVEFVKSERVDVQKAVETVVVKSQTATDEHKRLLKVHEHREVSLDYQHELKRKDIKNTSISRVDAWTGEFNQRFAAAKDERKKLKEIVADNDKTHHEEYRNFEQSSKNNLSNLRIQFAQQHEALGTSLASKFDRLKEQLDLRLRVEVHELEERKNQHLRQLQHNHETAFTQMKQYYTEITKDNCDLLMTLRTEIDEMRAKEKDVQKLNYKLMMDNKEISEPLKRLTDERNELLSKVAENNKNNDILRNLQLLSNVQLTTKLKETKKTLHRLEDRLKKLEKEKDDIKRRFTTAIVTVNEAIDFKNQVIQEKLKILETETQGTVPWTYPETVPDLKFDLDVANLALDEVKKLVDAKLKVIGVSS